MEDYLVLRCRKNNSIMLTRYNNYSTTYYLLIFIFCKLFKMCNKVLIDYDSDNYKLTNRK